MTLEFCLHQHYFLFRKVFSYEQRFLDPCLKKFIKQGKKSDMNCLLTIKLFDPTIIILITVTVASSNLKLFAYVVKL